MLLVREGHHVVRPQVVIQVCQVRQRLLRITRFFIKFNRLLEILHQSSQALLETETQVVQGSLTGTFFGSLSKHIYSFFIFFGVVKVV